APSVSQEATIWVAGSAPNVRCSPCTGGAPEPPDCGRTAGAASAGVTPSSGIAAAAPAPPSSPSAWRRLRVGEVSGMPGKVGVWGERDVDDTRPAGGPLLEGPAASLTGHEPRNIRTAAYGNEAELELAGQRVPLGQRAIDRAAVRSKA